jgi:hypothetical protein
MGIVANTGLTNRVQLVTLLNEAIERDKELQAQALAAQQQAAAGPTDPMQLQVQQLGVQLQLEQLRRDIVKTQAETAQIIAETQLTQAKTQTELVQPAIQTRETMMKGIYNTPEEQMAAEFDRRLKMAELVEARAERESDERIARMQVQGNLAATAIEAEATKAAAPKPEVIERPVPTPVPVPVPVTPSPLGVV